MVTSVDVYKEIRRLQLEGVTSQRRAATLLGISRNTVKKYWEGNAVPWERQTYEREAAVLTPEVVRFIENCLEADAQERVRKQHHTARRIYNRLVEECGFTGSESSIRKAVHKLRAQRGAVETYVPLRFVPGSAMQVDWGEAVIYLGGQRMAVNLFCARLCFSCAPFVIAYERQNLESFLDALTRAISSLAVYPDRSSLTMPVSPLRADLALMPLHKRTMHNLQHTTASSLCFVIQRPVMRRGWSKTWLATFAAMSVFRCLVFVHWKSSTPNCWNSAQNTRRTEWTTSLLQLARC